MNEQVKFIFDQPKRIKILLSMSFVAQLNPLSFWHFKFFFNTWYPMLCVKYAYYKHAFKSHNNLIFQVFFNGKIISDKLQSKRLIQRLQFTFSIFGKLCVFVSGFIGNIDIFHWFRWNAFWYNWNFHEIQKTLFIA